MRSPIAVVVSTVGRPSIELLLRSLVAQVEAPGEVVLVDQSGDSRTWEIASEFQNSLPVRVTRSRRGAALGRNTGAEEVSDDSLAIFFTDDDCVLAPEAIQQARLAIEDGFTAVAGGLSSTLGTRGQLKASGRVEVTRQNVWTHSIEAALVIRTAAFRQIGGFDASLGVGASTPWQSGEGTDLLLRGMRADWKLVHDPAVQVYEDSEPIGPQVERRKSRLYGAGTAAVYVRHYGLAACGWMIIRPLLGAALFAVIGRRRHAEKLISAALGRAEIFRPRVWRLRSPKTWPKASST